MWAKMCVSFGLGVFRGGRRKGSGKRKGLGDVFCDTVLRDTVLWNTVLWDVRVVQVLILRIFSFMRFWRGIGCGC